MVWENVGIEWLNLHWHQGKEIGNISEETETP